MKRLLGAGVGVASAVGVLVLAGCGGGCIDDGFAWNQGKDCALETASATDSDSDSATDGATEPTDGASESNSVSNSESVTESSNSNSMSATETATESASATDTDGGLWCEDADGDGFGDPNKCSPEEGPGTVPNDDDCADDNPDAFPGSAENDSDVLCEEDADGDGWGDMNPPPGVDPGTDCSDADARVHDTCACVAGSAKCDGDDLLECNDRGTMEDITTCEFGCDDDGAKCWDALTVDAGASVCIDPDTAAQLNAIAMGGDGMYTYAWTPADTLSDAAIANPEATPAAVTEYTVDVSDGEGNRAQDTVSVFVKNQTLTLDPQICTVYDFPHEDNDGNMDPVANWEWNENTSELCETLNAKASALFCGWELDNATIDGTFSVNTANDDDWVGFMWGIQDTAHFYVFTWKQAGQLGTTCGNVQVPAGMQVKVVDVQDPMMAPLACVDIHEPADTANSRLLVAVDDFTPTGWADNTEYRFQLTHKSDGEMTIVVTQADNDMLVAEKTFMDTTYAKGQFGMYTKSQINACFSDFKVSCEP
jgi:hypothetical protein